MAHPKPYTGRDKDSFAYPTIKDQCPNILNKAMDCFLRNAVTPNDLDEEHMKKAEQEKKDIIGQFSKLRYELQTDKPIEGFPDDECNPELTLWNKQLGELNEELKPATWFSAPWLFIECIMYRKIIFFFETSSYFKGFDPFEEQKRAAMSSSLKSAIALAGWLNSLTAVSKDVLINSLEMCLWGNKCDLGLTGGDHDMSALSYIDDLAKMRPKILNNDIPKIADFLMAQKNKAEGFRLSIVMDNTGFEWFTDLCLLDILSRCGILNQKSVVNLYVKTIPWFISDTTLKDFNWQLDFLAKNTESVYLKQLSAKWQHYLKEKLLHVVENDFWTLGYDYSRMQEIDPKLYQELSAADLVIFKGDLNYRKLVGDFHWDFTTPFKETLRGFHPTNLCSLRTIKADVVAGIESMDLVKDLPKGWTRTGTYAVTNMLLK